MTPTDPASTPTEPDVPRASPDHAGQREPWTASLVVAFGLLAAYLPTLAPGPTFTDGPEITVAIDRLGVIHPTGYPIFTVLAHVFTRLFAVPLPVIVKVELFNALCGVGAGLLVLRATRELHLGTRARAVGLPRSSRGTALSSAQLRELVAALPAHEHAAARFGGTVAGLLLGWSPLLWAQVRIPEVYAFHALLVAFAVTAWVRFETTRREIYVVVAALPMGMGLAHHVTMVFMLPAALAYLLLRRPTFFLGWATGPAVRLVRLVRPRFMAGLDVAGAWGLPLACLVGAIPIASYAYLLWANANTDGVNWGGVSDWSGVWDHMTGRQYRRFTETRELDSYWRRITKLPAVFDQQFLASGALLFFAGLGALGRRATAFGLFALLYLGLSVAHGVHYAVADYANYYLPAVLAASLFVGAGACWVQAKALAWPERTRTSSALFALAATLAGYALMVLYYARYTRRLARWLAPHAAQTVSLPLGVLAVVLLGLGLVQRFLKPGLLPNLGPKALPRMLAGALAVIVVPAVLARGQGYRDQAGVGSSYGEDVTSTIPRGGLLLTQGDGYLFTMWYEHHVLGRGTDTVTLDMGNLKTPWYQGYLRGRYPASCDPLEPKALLDPTAFEERCGTFRKRIELGAETPWVSLGSSRGGKRRTPVETSEPIVRGSQPPCADSAFATANPKACRCWGYGKRAGHVEAYCVPSVEEGGIAPREDLEIFAHRIIEDEIDVRPVFERNVFTYWMNDKKLNARGWKGPAYFRPPGQYDLLNRGRVNQVVHHDDLVSHANACASETARPVALRALRSPRRRKPQAPRELYLPNDRPTLITATYLTPEGRGDDDDASRRFGRGQVVHLRVDWFEKFAFDSTRPDRRGAPIREGVRFCVFDPTGARVAVEDTVSGAGLPRPLLETTSESALGRYLVQGCSVGSVGARKPPYDDLPCRRIVLEYELEVGP